MGRYKGLRGIFEGGITINDNEIKISELKIEIEKKFYEIADMQAEILRIKHTCSQRSNHMKKLTQNPDQTARNKAAFQRDINAGLSEDEPIDPHEVREE
jgi:chromosome segregation ATPase